MPLCPVWRKGRTVMDFFNDSADLGGVRLNRKEIHRRIEDLYGRIDDEKEKKEELQSELARIDREICRFRDLIYEMESMLR